VKGADLRAPPAATAAPSRWAALRGEAAMIPVLATALLFVALGGRWLVILPNVALSAFAFAWLFAMIVVGSMSVVRHADRLAEMLGEPYGTLILTLSVATIEIVTIGIVMTTGAPNPALAATRCSRS
jgi:Ca2+:H+ antiporter